MGVEIRCGVEWVRHHQSPTPGRGLQAFYIAIGCQAPEGNIPGEDSVDVMTAVDFLRTVAERAYPVEGKDRGVGGGNVAIRRGSDRQPLGGEREMLCLGEKQNARLREEIAEARKRDHHPVRLGSQEIHTETAGLPGKFTFLKKAPPLLWGPPPVIRFGRDRAV